MTSVQFADGQTDIASECRAPLSDDLRHELRWHFTGGRLGYIAAVLSNDELRVTNLADALILARIKRMSCDRLKRFDRFVPRGSDEQRHYQTVQLEWINGERYLLATRLGRTPTHRELSADFTAHRNGQRFRAYYVMKFPSRMKAVACKSSTETLCTAST